MIDFLNIVGGLAFVIVGLSIWYFVFRYGFVYVLLWPVLWIVFFGWAQFVENIDPNWCEKQTADNGLTYSTVDWDEYERRCL